MQIEFTCNSTLCVRCTFGLNVCTLVFCGVDGVCSSLRCFLATSWALTQNTSTSKFCSVLYFFRFFCIIKLIGNFVRIRVSAVGLHWMRCVCARAHTLTQNTQSRRIAKHYPFDCLMNKKRITRVVNNVIEWPHRGRRALLRDLHWN